MDTLRADRLGCYGAERDTSPAIDRLAAEGVLFREAMATSPWTLPSHVSLLTGLSSEVHRVTAAFHRIDPARRLLAEHLRDSGYATAAFVSAPFLHRAYGFDRGFDLYRNLQGTGEATLPPAPEAHQGSHLDRSAAQVIDGALAWMRDRPPGGEPWFLFVHLWDAHYDFDPPPPYDTLFDPGYEGGLDFSDFQENDAIHRRMDPRDLEHLLALYDGEIRWLDSQLERLFDAVRERDAAAPLVVALVADHGEEFFEHQEKGHMKALYEESVRVPWILRYPGVLAPGAVVEGAVALDDVAPTLLGLAGLPPLEEATGLDLSSRLVVGPSTLGGERLLSHGRLAALRGPGWKVYHDRAAGYAAYYDLVEDPGEQAPKSARSAAPEKFERLQAALEAAQRHGASLAWAEEGEAVELDEATRERLRGLGYLD